MSSWRYRVVCDGNMRLTNRLIVVQTFCTQVQLVKPQRQVPLDRGCGKEIQLPLAQKSRQRHDTSSIHREGNRRFSCSSQPAGRAVLKRVKSSRQNTAGSASRNCIMASCLPPGQLLLDDQLHRRLHEHSLVSLLPTFP